MTSINHDDEDISVDINGNASLKKEESEGVKKMRESLKTALLARMEE